MSVQCDRSVRQPSTFKQIKKKSFILVSFSISLSMYLRFFLIIDLKFCNSSYSYHLNVLFYNMKVVNNHKYVLCLQFTKFLLHKLCTSYVLACCQRWDFSYLSERDALYSNECKKHICILVLIIVGCSS